MKITITGDNHLHFLRRPSDAVAHFMEQIESHTPDIILNLGDIGEGQQGIIPAYSILLKNSLFILGNHDLWRIGRSTPPDAMRNTLKTLPQEVGTPLEKSWTDKTTIVKIKDHAFVGTIGFPDFAHPALETFSKDYWDRNPATNDPRFMDLKKGWLEYTIPLQQAFIVRLTKAFSKNVKHVVIATHYPTFEEQCFLSMDPSEKTIWPFFFNWTLGQKIIELAKQNPDKTIWCFAAHSHEYCSGQLSMVAPNIYTYGFVTTYGNLEAQYFDTSLNLNEQRRNLAP